MLRPSSPLIELTINAHDHTHDNVRLTCLSVPENEGWHYFTDATTVDDTEAAGIRGDYQQFSTYETTRGPAGEVINNRSSTFTHRSSKPVGPKRPYGVGGSAHLRAH